MEICMTREEAKRIRAALAHYETELILAHSSLKFGLQEIIDEVNKLEVKLNSQ